jgi:hypothetical protein
MLDEYKKLVQLPILLTTKHLWWKRVAILLLLLLHVLFQHGHVQTRWSFFWQLDIVPYSTVFEFPSQTKILQELLHYGVDIVQIVVIVLGQLRKCKRVSM